MRIGIIGCGNISETYFNCQKIFNNIKIISCADINNNLSKKLQNLILNLISVDDILENNEIDIIINLNNTICS